MRKTLNRLGSPESFLVVLMFAVHGWLLLNDGVYFDGWLVYFPIEENNFEQLDYVMSIYGHVTRPYIHWVAGWLGGAVFGHKLLAFVSLSGVAILVYRLGAESELLTERESIWVALTFLLFPAYQIAPELIMLPYHVSYFLFMLASYLLFRALRGGHWVLRVLSLPLFAVSFWISSFVVFFGGIVIFLWLLGLADYSLRGAFRSGLKFALRHPDLILLPFFFWLVLRPINEPKLYNEVGFSASTAVNNLSSFLRFSVVGQVIHSLDLLWGLPLLLLGGILLAQWLYERHILATEMAAEKKPALPLAAFGSLTLAFAIIPYLAVEKAPLLHGWYTRHALLISLPIGLLTVAVWRAVVIYAGDSLRRVMFTGIVLLWCGYGLSHWESYFELQARWAKDASVAEHLRQYPHEIDVFWIDDRFPTGWEDLFYYNYDWVGIFKTVWADSRAVGIFFDDYAGSYYWINKHDDPKYYFGVDFNPRGCQAILTIKRGTRPQHYTAGGLSIRYLAYKYLYPAGLKSFLLGVTEVQVRRILSAEALDCPLEQAFLPTLPPDDPLFSKFTPNDEGAYNHLNRLAFIIEVERRNDISASQAIRYPELQEDLMEMSFYPLNIETRAIYPFPDALEGIDEEFYYRYYQTAWLLATEQDEAK